MKLPKFLVLLATTLITSSPGLTAQDRSASELLYRTEPSLARTWELGLMAGVGNYSGELAQNFTEKDEYHVSLGIFAQYNAHDFFSVRGRFAWTKLTGEDIGDSPPRRQIRLTNFKNHILEGSLTFHWHFLKYGIGSGKKFAPSLFAGVGIFRNQPMGRIFLDLNERGDPLYLTWHQGSVRYDGVGDDIWVRLRDIGTEGQTTDRREDPEASSPSLYSFLFNGRTPPKKYSNIQISLPIGMTLNYIVHNKWIIGVEGSIHFTLTDYIDDVGGFYYDRINDHQLIVDANPSITGRAKRNTVALPYRLIYTNTNGQTVDLPTAAILANPSLVISQPSGNAQLNYAYALPSAHRAVGVNDLFFFLEVKVSKVFGKKSKEMASRTSK